MSFDDKFGRAVLAYYKQGGSGFPVFRGADVQYGRGFADILKSIARFVIPIFAPAATKFITSTAGGLGEGRSLKESLKGAIKPALSEAVSATGSSISNRMSQKGFGRRRRSRKKRTQKKKFVFPGVYKGAGKKRKTAHKKRKSAKRRRTSKIARFPNF